MIHSFICADTEALFRSQVVPRFRNIERVARRKLLPGLYHLSIRDGVRCSTAAASA